MPSDLQVHVYSDKLQPLCGAASGGSIHEKQVPLFEPGEICKQCLVLLKEQGGPKRS